MKKTQSKTDERKSQSKAQPITVESSTDESLDLTPESSVEQVQMPKSSRGKQELNNELQIKADELENLFAFHKLRVMGENASSIMREKHGNSSQDPGHGVVEILEDVNLLGNDRGGFYERYMQKRDAKLREEWKTKGVQKEAKMKELQDDLESSSAEMKVNFGGSASRMDPNSCQHSTRNIKQSVNFQLREEKEAQKTFEQNDYSEDTLVNETNSTISSEGSSNGSHSEKRPFRKQMAVSTQSLVLRVPKRSTRPTNSKPRKSEKETQSRRYNRVLRKNGVLNQSKTTRKTASSSTLQKDLSTMDFGKSSLFLLKLSKEKNESNQTVNNILGNLRDEEESVGSPSCIETLSNIVNGDDVKDQIEKITTRSVSGVDSKGSLNDDGSIDSGDQESENVQDDSPATAVTSLYQFNMLVTTQESLTSSPVTLNSRTHSSSPCAQEASVIDASVESPEGIPSLWNSDPPVHMAEDAVRMRNMWGNAQRSDLISHTSHQSKSKRKVFKRLLKFGRKSKGSQTVITDQLSASTNSEGDEKIRDDRDPANRISDDMKKSRTCRPQPPSSDYRFKNGVNFQDEAKATHSVGNLIPAAPADFKIRKDHLSRRSLKAPCAFFSLSTFRSKATESKFT